MKYNSYRFRLLFWFLTFSLIILLVIISFNDYYFKKKENIFKITHEINHLNNLFLNNSKIISDFLRYETSKSEFYKTHVSQHLDKRKDINVSIVSRIKIIKENKNYQEFQISNEIDSLESLIVGYNTIFAKMLEKIILRGFKDYGIVGKMRNYVHLLENYNIDQTNVLSLRRHEKDYIIRNEDIYVKKLNDLSEEFQKELKSSNQQNNDSLVKILKNYTLYFNKIVHLDKEIGLRENIGLKANLDYHENLIKSQINSLIFKADEKREELFNRLQTFYTVFFILLSGIIILVHIFISRSITRPLASLSDTIVDYVNKDFKSLKKMDISKYPEEIKILYEKFNYMIDKLYKRELARIKAESNIIENELKYREIADLLPQGILETDEHYVLTYVNDAWLESFRYSRNDLDNELNLFKTVYSEDETKIIQNVKDDRTKHIEYKALRKDGTSFNAILYTTPIFRLGKFRGIRGILMDITERKKYIENLTSEKVKAQESDKLKSTFLANMSHDIRTPMNAIIGFSEILESHYDNDDERYECIQHIKSNGEILVNLINDIIDISKIEAGELQLQKSPTDLNAIINDLYKTFSIAQGMKENENLRLIRSVPLGDESIIILTDPLRLKQIFSNLINNAIKFTREGFVEFGYRINENHLLELFVKDTGAGINKNRLNEIFKPFKQANNQYIKREGTGLGLAISKELVQLLGGEIWVESTEEVGSVFSFTLPFNPIESIERYSMDNNIKKNQSCYLENKTILIAEDEDSNYKLLEKVLMKRKVKVMRAANGKEAYELIRNNHQFDIILMDLQMPILSGYQALKKIKEYDNNIPVIAQTAFAMTGENQKCLEAGFIDYISKPIDLKDLISKLNKHIKN